MTDATLNVKKAVDSLRDVTGQIALLLKTADGLMDEHGWGIRLRNCVSGSSGIDGSFEWVPGYFFRTYSNDDYPLITAYVCVILAAPWKGEEKFVTVPLISVCWCYWGNSKKPSTELLAGWAPCHIWTEKRKDDGTIIFCDVKKQFPKDFKNGTSEFYSLALPLADIASSADLDSKIIKPFVAGVEKQHGRQKGK